MNVIINARHVLIYKIALPVEEINVFSLLIVRVEINFLITELILIVNLAFIRVFNVKTR
jgi:hypothetical protein